MPAFLQEFIDFILMKDPFQITNDKSWYKLIQFRVFISENLININVLNLNLLFIAFHRNVRKCN